VVACHGFTCIPFGTLALAQVEGWRGRSSVLGGALTGRRLRTLALGLYVIAGAVILAAAAAIAATPWAPGWWRPLAIIGGAVGGAAFFTFYDGEIRRAVPEGAIGLVASVAMLAVAIALPGAFAP
jgi:hypothetical protein